MPAEPVSVCPIVSHGQKSQTCIYTSTLSRHLQIVRIPIAKLDQVARGSEVMLTLMTKI